MKEFCNSTFIKNNKRAKLMFRPLGVYFLGGSGVVSPPVSTGSAGPF